MLSNDSRITVFPASQQGLSTTFTNQVVFNTLRMSDDGAYTCQATVVPRGSIAGAVTNGVGSANAATLTIQGTYVHKIIIKAVYVAYTVYTILSYTVYTSYYCN